LSINHVASMFQVFFTGEKVWDFKTAKSADVDKFKLLQLGLLKKGIFVPPSQFETCFLSDMHSEDDLRNTVSCFSDLLVNISRSS
jgi:glutamate-1-semialdehyde 2,1-aminomutase